MTRDNALPLFKSVVFYFYTYNIDKGITTLIHIIILYSICKAPGSLPMDWGSSCAQITSSQQHQNAPIWPHAHRIKAQFGSHLYQLDLGNQINGNQSWWIYITQNPVIHATCLIKFYRNGIAFSTNVWSTKRCVVTSTHWVEMPISWINPMWTFHP